MFPEAALSGAGIVAWIVPCPGADCYPSGPYDQLNRL